MTGPRLVLASQSPARLATLRAAGLDPEVVVSGVDESTVVSDDPEELSVELARLKARAVAARLPAVEGNEPAVEGKEPAVEGKEPAVEPVETFVVGCDSVLEIDGGVHGKPGTAEAAARRWRSLRGSSGVLHTGHCVIDVGSGRELARAARTVVHFADLSDAEIAAYVATGEPLEVAGAFTIDGLGGAYITGIEGDPHTVVGISLPLLRSMFGELGHAWHEFWRAGIDGSSGGLSPS